MRRAWVATSVPCSWSMAKGSLGGMLLEVCRGGLVMDSPFLIRFDEYHEVTLARNPPEAPVARSQ
eukprot:4937943-Lingulodinium_polyedra.AAC.1